jgi:hypothetical protein
MIEPEGPIGIRMNMAEFLPNASVGPVGQGRARDRRGGVDRVDAGLVEGDGSALANIPMSATTGASLFAQQSQFGDTFITKLTWKCGLPRRIASVYSAIRSLHTLLAEPSLARAAENWQTATHWQQPTQRRGRLPPSAPRQGRWPSRRSSSRRARSRCSSRDGWSDATPRGGISSRNGSPPPSRGFSARRRSR